MPDMNAYVQWQERERKVGNSGENPDKTILTISIPSEHSFRLAIDTVITVLAFDITIPSCCYITYQ